MSEREKVGLLGAAARADKRRKVGRTLDPNYDFPRDETRQVYTVFLKNILLALRSWITYLVFYIFEAVMIIVVGVILVSLGEQVVNSDDATFNTPDGKFSPSPRSNKQLGPALTWVSPSFRTESITDKVGWGSCEQDSMTCGGMIGSINKPMKYKSDSSGGQLSMRVPYNESLPMTQWTLYPAFQQDDLKEFLTFDTAKKAGNEIIQNQLIKIRQSDLDNQNTTYNLFDIIYPWAVFAKEYENPAEQMYIPSGESNVYCSSYPKGFTDYTVKASHHIMLPRKSQNIVSIVSDAYAMEAVSTLQTALMRYTLSEHFSTSDVLNEKYSYLMMNSTWRALPYYQYSANNSNTAESIGMYIYPLVMLIILIPNILYSSASEKQTGTRRMETLMGLDQYKRVLGDFCFYGIIAAIGVIIMIIIGVIFGLPFFVHTDAIYLILLVFSTIIVVPLHGIFLTSFFSSGKSAALLGLLLIVVEYVFFFGLSGNHAYYNGWWNLYPIFGWLGLYRSISEGVIPNSPSYWITTENLYSDIPEVRNGCIAVILDSILSIVISIVVYVPLGLYIENIMPNNRIRRPWLYPLEGIVRKAHAIECARIAGPAGCPYEIECSSYDTNLNIKRIFQSISIIIKNKKYHWLDTSKKNAGAQGSESDSSSSKANVNTDTDDKSTSDYDGVASSSASDDKYISNGISKIRIPINKTEAYLRSLSDVITYQKYVDEDRDLKSMQRRAAKGEGEEPKRPDVVRIIGLIKAYGKLPRKLAPVSSINLDDALQSANTPSNLKVSVKGVSFTVRYDECFGLLGPNGAGKSTTLTILSGANKQSAGRVLVDGVDTSYTDKKGKKHITSITGVCEQFDTLYGKLTVEEHLRHAAWIKGISPKILDEHVTDIIDGVGLTAQRKMRSANMSGGMQRRLSVGLAMVCSPKIIYFDEPTTGLDPETRRSLWLTLMGLKRKRSLVICTHALDECEYLCSSPASNIAIMANGGLRGIGTAEYLKRRFGEGAKIQVMVSGNIHMNNTKSQNNSVQGIPGSHPNDVDNSSNDNINNSDNNNNKNNNNNNLGVDDLSADDVLNASRVAENANGIFLTPNEQIVHNIIMTRVNVSLVSAYCGTLTYNILNDNLPGGNTTTAAREAGGTAGSGKRPKIAGVFRIMEQIAQECPAVTDWGVSLTSLESVFLNIVSASAECQV